MEEKIIFGGEYSVTSDGKVYSLKHGKKELKGGRCCKGGKYIYVTIFQNGKGKNYSIHRLVAQAFIPNPNSLPQVNHIDGNSLNNNVSNLEWVTNSENQIHAYRTGLSFKYSCLICGRRLQSNKHSLCCWCREKAIQNLEKSLWVLQKSGKSSGPLSNVSERKDEILLLIAQGNTYREVAKLVGCSFQYVGIVVKECLFDNQGLSMKG